MDESIKEDIVIEGEKFSLILERQRGVALYANEGRSKYLRYGQTDLGGKELAFHRKLLALGFPVAEIISEGTLKDGAYWIEASLGQKHFGGIFREETETSGEISEVSFATLLRIIKSTHNAQERSVSSARCDFDHIERAMHFSEMLRELPDHAEVMGAAWEKAARDLSETPACLTHGDFTSHNILPGGVIDFGDHFEGPVGFDMINLITSPFWFPTDRSFEFSRGYGFSEKHIERFFAAVGKYVTSFGDVDIQKQFDALFFLKANWWAVRNQRMPKLQAWRYERYLEITRRYLAGESLYEYWLARKDD